MQIYFLQNIMYVFGGALLPSEELTNELWALDLNNLTWTILTTPPTTTPSYPPSTTRLEPVTSEVTVYV